MRNSARRIAVWGGAAALVAGLASAAPAGAVPTITGTDTDSWNQSSPAVTYVITSAPTSTRITWELETEDGSSGPGSGTPTRSGGGQSPLTVSIPDLADGTFTLTARDRGLLAGTAVRTFTVDRTAPVIRIDQPADGVTVAQGAPLLASFACDGATSCTGSVASGAALDTSRPGPGALRVDAADAAGNTVRAQVGYLVLAPGQPQPPPVTPAATPTPTKPKTINASRLRPRLNGLVASRRPTLKWPERAGARFYNVQIFRLKKTGAPAKVMSAFPRTNSIRVPPGRLLAGTRYAWRVWPFMKRGFTPKPLGLSVFAVKKSALR